MPFRRTFKRTARVRKKAIWCNVPFSFTMSETAGQQILLVGEDWEAQFTGLANETAVLRGIRGVLFWCQTAAGTLGNSAFWGLGIRDNDETVIPSFTVSGMSEVDWLHTDAFAAQGTLAGTTACIQRTEINIKSKRKLRSRDSIFIFGQFAADAASPTANIGGILRFLIARD